MTPPEQQSGTGPSATAGAARATATVRPGEIRPAELVVQVGRDGCIHRVHGDVEELLGWTTDELIGMSGTDLVHPDDLRSAGATQAGPSDHGRAEVRVRCRDGGYRWLSAIGAPIVDEHGAVAGRISVLRDVADDHKVRDQYRTLAELATDIVGRVTVDGRFEWVSPSVRTVLGWDPDDLVGRSVLEFIDPLDLRAAGLTPDEAMGGREVAIDARVMSSDGGRRWMSVLLRPIRDEQDRIVGRVVGWRDVHDEHLARMELTERETQYRLLAEHSSDVVVQVDNEGVVRWVSPSITERFGWRPEELIGRTNDHLLHPDDRVRLQDARTRAARGEFPDGAFEVRYMARDGKYSWLSVRARPIRDELGNIIGRISSWRDVDEEHRVRERLRESEERMRLLVENATDVVLQADRDGVIEWISESVRHMLGRSSWELVGTPVADHVHPDDVPVLLEAQADVNRGRDVRFEMRVFTADGDTLWMSSVARPLFSPTGKVIGRVAGWRNIDAERSVRERLRESEERLRFVLDNVTDVVVHQVDGIPVYVSPSITKLLGWQPEDMLGRLVTEFWHPDDQAAAVAARAQVMHGEPIRRHVLRMRHKAGHYRYIEISAQPAESPEGRPAAVGLLRDVTDQVEAEQALAEAQERDRLMAELSSDVFIIYAADGTIVWANGATQQIVGVPPEELLGTDGFALFFPEESPTAEERREAMARGELIAGVVRIRRPDGGAHWVDRRTRAVRDGDGNVRFYASSWRDAQAEVEYRQRLAASEREAKVANLAKTTFLSRMSHELRTPLNAVLGFGQLLEMDEMPGDQHQAVEQILAGGRHLLELINEVLDIARIESGRMSMSPEAVMASDVITRALDLIRPLGATHQVDLPVFDMAGGETLVRVDRQRTIQVLLNLLSNAIKYNRVGGAVRVVCRELDDEFVAIDVEDDGIGIAPELLPRLFEPFDRLGAEVSGVEGTGIGLALSRGLAEMMHGRIEVRSTPGVGSVFTLVLPRTAAVASAPEAGGGTRVSVGESSSRVVLYVEDNPANALLMRSIVGTRPGVELREAATGESAVEWATADVPDLVLLDLHLPDIPGEEVLRRLRTDARTATVPVVVLSADAAQDVSGRLGALGADAFLAKPVDLADVLSWIDDPLRARRGTAG